MAIKLESQQVFGSIYINVFQWEHWAVRQPSIINPELDFIATLARTHSRNGAVNKSNAYTPVRFYCLFHDQFT